MARIAALNDELREGRIAYADLQTQYWQMDKKYRDEIASLEQQLNEAKASLQFLSAVSLLSPVIPILNQKWAQEDSEVQSLLRPIIVEYLQKIG